MKLLFCRAAVAAASFVSLSGQVASAAHERPGEMPSVEMSSPLSSSQQQIDAADEALASIEGRAAFASMRDRDPEVNGFGREVNPALDESK